ncbi:hypothetical protein CHELA1G2_20858 [Hyphomicrobiales bacterium]|nr:hypothetical protein CHELA1G2_20858 [Hyphomicrobiales bacterium]
MQTADSGVHPFLPLAIPFFLLAGNADAVRRARQQARGFGRYAGRPSTGAGLRRRPCLPTCSSRTSY